MDTTTPTPDEVTTVTVRGSGGDEFRQDVPPLGTIQREVFDEMRRKGVITIIAGDAPPLSSPAPLFPALPVEG